MNPVRHNGAHNIGAQEHNHQPNAQFQRGFDTLRNAESQSNDGGAYETQRQRMAGAPEHATQYNSTARLLTGTYSSNCGQVICLKSMLHAHKSAKQQEAEQVHAHRTLD